MAVHDFAKQKSWPELVPALKTAIHNSDLVTVPAPSEFKTLNVLIALQTIIKPFQVHGSLSHFSPQLSPCR